MLLGETLRVALQSIRANLFRAILTMLGIVIGVAAVITMLAAGAGAQKNIEDQIDALGANLLSISAQSWFLRGISRQQLTLEVEDVWALEEKTQYIDLVVPRLEDRGQIKYGNRNLNVRLVGTTDGYMEIYGYDLAAGEMFTRADDETKRRVAVFGGVLPQQLEIENPED
ncbi:MAG: ABC transporter permease, partial [Gammaproteobacteria bacterium]|nr:ABC transporter permease [Gammaproteobacteria bacterium]